MVLKLRQVADSSGGLVEAQMAGSTESDHRLLHYELPRDFVICYSLLLSLGWPDFIRQDAR